MKRHNFPIGKIMGIRIGLDYSWFLIFGLITWLMASSYYPSQFKDWPEYVYWLMGAATAILLFVSVVLHELGHSAVAIRFKVPVHNITLFLFGGVSEIEAEPPNAKAEFLIAIAGPLVSLILAGVFELLKPVFATVRPVWALVEYLAYINFALAVFNLIPGYPLDGGRVLRAIVWRFTNNMRRATTIAANTGRFFGFLFIFLGILMMLRGDFGNGIWIAFIGWYLDNAASAEAQQSLYQGLLAGHTVAQAMGPVCPSVAGDQSIEQLVNEHISGTGQRCFLVQRMTDHARGAENVGLITLGRLHEVPREQWAATTVEQAMVPMDQVKRTTPQSGLWPALEEMEHDGVNQLLVTNDGQVSGMLRRADVIAFLNTVKEVGG